MNVRSATLTPVEKGWEIRCHDDGHLIGRLLRVSQFEAAAFEAAGLAAPTGRPAVYSVLIDLYRIKPAADGTPRYGQRQGAFLRGRPAHRRVAGAEGRRWGDGAVAFEVGAPTGPQLEPRYLAKCLWCGRFNLVDKGLGDLLP